MAGAIARGWFGASRAPEAMGFHDLERERAESLAEEVGGGVAESLAELAAESDWLVLAVKPAALDAVAAELEVQAPGVLSVLAATSLQRIEAAFPGVSAIRLMPNQPVEVRRGLLCYAVRPETRNHAAPLIELLGALGELVELPDEEIDAATAVMSCSPAYVALLAEALATAGVAEGLDADLSRRLVAETISGTGQLLREREPAELRRRVAPPGGATEAGLEALESAGFEQAIRSAVDASLERIR